MEGTRVVQATEKGNIWEGGHYFHIQCSAPTELAAFMRKRHLNSDSIAHSSLYLLQKGLDGTSIPMIPLRHTGGGLRCNRKDYIRKGTPRRRDGHFMNWEKENLRSYYKNSVLTINEQSILRPTQGRLYTKSLLHSFILITFVLLSSSLWFT